ncbi:MAG: DUF1343 domain-containing protein [Deltaproteobacteria bacterium]|nr:DUF1343 domain-containing protein [Deltaproteobacteria bacterium]
MSQVLTGLDVLVEEKFKRLKGLKVGLLAHPASVDSKLKHILHLCLEHGVQVKHLFGPEHGFWGNAQDMEGVESSIDAKTGLPITSLYGSTRESLSVDPKALKDVDVLLCDLQDIGSRYYTFAYTIAFAIRACAKAKIKCLVVDRPNPLGGVQKEGNLVQKGFESFVGEYPLQNRHGMTLGELARFFKEHDGLDTDLEVVEMQNWNREQHFGETGLPWVMTSPNMPTPDTALVYPGGCLFEGTNLSEGRGTTRPFELAGAPYIQDPDRFAELASSCELPGAVLRPCWFTPTFQKHAGKLCGGLQIHVTDKKQFNALKTGVAVIWAARQFEGFDWRREPYEFVSDRLAIDLLFGSDEPRKLLESGAGADAVMESLSPRA